MPFKETCPVEERIAMLRDYGTGVFSVSEVARRHGVSRETFYLWQRRQESGDPRWFEERSRAPEVCPHTAAVEHVDAVIDARRRFPHFGPKKIKAWLASKQPKIDWPAASTIGDILKRAGMVEARGIHRRPIAQGEIVHPATSANAEWAIDFKGWFRTRDGTRCDPLTVTDAASRYLLQVRIIDQTYADVRCSLERLFDEAGLPGAMRSDNGTPFGSTGAGGLSALSVWLLKLGIEPRYIPPSSPQHNGRHERMHRTLKAQTARPAAATGSASTTTRIGRTRPSSRHRQPGTGSRLPGAIPGRLQTPGMTPIIRFGVYAGRVASSGEASTCSSARRWPESWLGSPTREMARHSSSSATAISASSTTRSASSASLRRVRGCAQLPRRNVEQTRNSVRHVAGPKCQESSRLHQHPVAAAGSAPPPVDVGSRLKEPLPDLRPTKILQSRCRPHMTFLG